MQNHKLWQKVTYMPVSRPSLQVNLGNALQFPLDSPLPYILFNTILPCPSQTGRWRWSKRNGRKVHSMKGNWCRNFEARCPSCHQPVLKTSTGTHRFFNHQQTHKGRDVAPFMSALRWHYPSKFNNNNNKISMAWWYLYIFILALTIHFRGTMYIGN